MTVPKPFEMVYGGEIYIITYCRAGGVHWTILVDGKPHAKGLRNIQNNWVVVADKSKIKYRGRVLQQVVMDCIRREFMKDDLG